MAKFKVKAGWLSLEMGPEKWWPFLFQCVTVLMVKVFLSSRQNFSWLYLCLLPFSFSCEFLCGSPQRMADNSKIPLLPALQAQ